LKGLVCVALASNGAGRVGKKLKRQNRTEAPDRQVSAVNWISAKPFELERKMAARAAMAWVHADEMAVVAVPSEPISGASSLISWENTANFFKCEPLERKHAARNSAFAQGYNQIPYATDQ
jgi:hypothetical protein